MSGGYTGSHSWSCIGRPLWCRFWAASDGKVSYGLFGGTAVGGRSDPTSLVAAVRIDRAPTSNRLGDELLNETLFTSLAEARLAINAWKEDYNNHRPHSALGNSTPAEFAMKTGWKNRPHEAKNETPDSALNWRENGSQVRSTNNRRISTLHDMMATLTIIKRNY
jgi:hypothetical protein